MTEREKVVKAFEFCLMPPSREELENDICSHEDCPYYREYNGGKCISAAVSDALALLKAQEPRVMTIQEIKNADFCYLEVNGHDGVIPVLLKHFIDDKYIHVTINGGSVYFFDITCDVEKLVRCWTSRPTDEQREAVKWDDTD